MRVCVTSWAQGLGLLTAGPAALSAQPEPPAPLVTEQTVKDQGRTYRLRTEEYAAAPIAVPVAELSIADLYAAGDGQGGAVAAATLSYRCPINDSGRIRLTYCIFSNGPTLRDRVPENLVLRAGDRITLPAFPVITQPKRDRIERYALLEFHVPAVELPVVDLTTGPLVEREAIPELAGPLPFKPNYPPRALRQAAQGMSVIECQIQQDLSVICRQISFEPADQAALFAREAGRTLGALKVSPHLADGSEARGARFRMTLNWRLN